MVEAYNYYAGGFIPKVNPKTNVHNRRELKNKYKSIVALNNANPLAMISLSKDTSDYALDVKSMSMELGEAASLALDSDQQGEALETTLQLYNKLLSRSDEYGELKNKPSRPGMRTPQIGGGVFGRIDLQRNCRRRIRISFP